MNNEVHDNPYRDGLYRQIFAFMREKRVFTRADLMRYTCGELGKEVNEANYAVTILMSPRKSSRIGDCRGNVAANGHLYYLDKLPRQMRAGVRDPQKFMLRWRTEPLEHRRRVTRLEVADLRELVGVIKEEGCVRKVNREVWRKVTDKIEQGD